MTLRDFKQLLTDNPAKSFQLRLDTGESVPFSFHITEVARVQKTFIDCGGKMHETDTCQLQAWVGSDEDHRLATSKLAGILHKARHFIPDDTVGVEIEYEATALSQYTVASAAVSDDAVVLSLESKHTDCLAKDVCLAPSPAASGCGCAPGCCN